MLTRISVKGFKNLLDCDVAFGPFTCVAGVNASGKSNLFDAIMFLRDLSDYSLVEAASRVRENSSKKSMDLKSLFTSKADGSCPDIDISAEFLVKKSVVDDFGREAQPSATHLRYRVVLRYVPQDGRVPEKIELLHESLTYIPKMESRKRLGFKTSMDFWNSVIGGSRRADFISTEDDPSGSIIRLRQDGSSRGRPLDILAFNSPRTVLSTINTDDKPTALAARREIQSWRILQLEPSKLRLPDEFSDETVVSSEGAHMPGALDRLQKYAEVANKLSELLPEVRAVGVDVDEGRRLKTLVVTQRDGSRHTARGLSDGTLRFLALAIISVDASNGGLVCLEEPENGIHPSRVSAMMSLLAGMASDTEIPVDEDNPLRQVIINTHSPIVVQGLDINNLLVSSQHTVQGVRATQFLPISGTWRERAYSDRNSVSIGALVKYLTEDARSDNDDDPKDDFVSVHQFVKGQLSLFGRD